MKKRHLLWIDLEMTGLNPEVDSIVELAVLVTTLDLTIVGSMEKVIYQPQSVLENMDPWCKEHHGKSGLTAKIPMGEALAKVEDDLCHLITRHFRTPAILAGNSISHDRKFIDKYLPKVSALLHYRMLDISSFKLIFDGLYQIKFKKKKNHRALDDIHESLAELKHYLYYIRL
jgi:oligoribonuclease